MSERPTKVCCVCGRTFEWRKKWKGDWEQVKYCSQKCRRTNLTKTDDALEEAILSLASERGASSSICPSEAARHVLPEAWRDWMERTRMAARRLVHEGKIEIRQKGKVVDPDHAKGPIRLRIKR
jgi:hypothetical protein